MPKKNSGCNKPRGSTTAYSLFVRTCRDELRRKHPDLSVDYNIISKKCSEHWKNMNSNEKKRFNDVADLQRQRCQENRLIYEQQQQQQLTMPVTQSNVNNSKVSGKKRKKKVKDPHAPKKPLSSYFLFVADERPKICSSQSGMSTSDIARELGIRWKQVSPELKIKYERTASELKINYQAAMAAYKHQTSINAVSCEESNKNEKTYSILSDVSLS